MSKDSVIFSLINVRKEKTLKNQPGFRRDEASLKALYENPPRACSAKCVNGRFHRGHQGYPSLECNGKLIDDRTPVA